MNSVSAEVKMGLGRGNKGNEVEEGAGDGDSGHIGEQLGEGSFMGRFVGEAG